MSSEQLADGVNPLDAELAATWDVLKGYSGRDTDLGIARRFGGASAAYSLRDIGAMNGRVVKVRRSEDDLEEDFSANQVASGALEDWVNGKLEYTLPADVATATAAYSLRKVKSDYSGDAVRIRRSSDDIEVDVAFDSDDKVSASSAITNVAEQGGESGSTSATDLNGFLNESTENFSAIAYASIDSSYRNFTSDPTISETAFSGTNGGTASRLCYSLPLQLTISEADGCKFKVTGTIDSLSGGDVTIKPTIQNNGSGSYTPAEGDKVISDGTTGAFEYIFTGNGVNEFKSVIFIIDASTTVSASNLKFEIIEHGATVHTWYDQAGSNDAVQETAANQPKIAENGALLDGINFNANTDGTSPDFLQVATRLGVTTDHFISAVFNGYQTDSSAFGAIINTRNGNAGYQYGIATTDNVQAFFYAGAGNNANSSSSFALSNNSAKRLVTFDKDGNDLTGFGNATTNGISLSNGVNTPSTTVTNIGVGGNVGTTTSLGLRANINELIVYETDQADNRFKIESNINNYYGLYNDANDLTQTEWQATGAESFSSTSTDGFSYSNSSSTAFIGVTLSETLPLNDSVFVSFNASGVDIPDESPQIRLRDSVSGGTATSSLIGVVQNGFNSFELTYDNSSYANGDNIVFSEGNTGGGTVTISDFKVSRIARNGFVETWYDQSGNGRDMIQDTATAQPAIVQNGGSVRTANGYHSIQFDGTDDYLNADSYSPAAFATGGLQDFNIQTVVGKPVLNSTNETVASCGSQEGSNVIGGFLLIHKQSTDATLQDVRFHISQGGQSGTHIAQIANLNKTTQDTNLLGFSRNSTDDGYILDLNENTSTATNTLYPATKQTGENANFKLGSAMYNSTALKFYSGQILETILFESNKEDDTSDIQNDLNNFYNI